MTQIILSKRNLFWMLLILLSTKAFSQKSVITTIDNEKIIVDDNSINLNIKGEVVSYKIPNSEKVTDIDFKKIKSAVLGDYRMNRMKIAEEKNEQLCFTIAETQEKKLIGFNKIVSGTLVVGPNSGKSSTTQYFIYCILGKDNKVIEKLKCVNAFGEKFAKERGNVEEIIKKQFSDCKEIMDRLQSSFDLKNTDVHYSKRLEKMANRINDENGNIILFFEKPRYVNCDQSSTQNGTTTSTLKKEESKSNFGNQNYIIGAISVDFRGMKKDIVYKGTYSIKDDSLIIATKDASVKYKIISYENGDLKYADGDVIQTINITSETGKTKGFAYDTKISITDKKNGGGNTSYYWCTKAAQ